MTQSLTRSVLDLYTEPRVIQKTNHREPDLLSGNRIIKFLKSLFRRTHMFGTKKSVNSVTNPIGWSVFITSSMAQRLEHLFAK